MHRVHVELVVLACCDQGIGCVEHLTAVADEEVLTEHRSPRACQEAAKVKLN